MIIQLAQIGLILGAVFFGIIVVSIIAIVLEYYFPLSKKPNHVTAEQFKASKRAVNVKQIR